MKLRKADWLFGAAVVLVVVFVSLLPSPRERNPPVPATEAHRGLKAEVDCLRCHVPGAGRPLSERHPKRKDCFRCHRQAADG